MDIKKECFAEHSCITLIGRDERNIFTVLEVGRIPDDCFIHCVQLTSNNINNIKYDNTCLKQILTCGSVLRTVNLSCIGSTIPCPNIIQASLSPSFKYLGLIDSQTIEATNDERNVKIFKCYLLDFESSKLTELNVESQLLIYIKFLYSDEKVKQQSNHIDNIQDKFLVLVHKQGVTQYSIAKDSMVIDPVIGRFLWCEWDLINHCLYVLHLRQPVQISEDAIAPKPTISCLQFHQHLPWETIFHMPLDLPHIQDLTCDDSSGYPEVSPLNIMANNKTNIKALSLSKGIACICLQHIRNGQLSLGYDILLLHHGKVLSFCHKDSNLKGKIQFSFYGEEFLIALLPGNECHLLQVGLDYPPMHHIKMSRRLLSFHVNSWDHQVLFHNFTSGRDENPAIFILNKTTNLLQKFSVSQQDFINEFLETDIPCVQLALLQLFLRLDQQEVIIQLMLDWISKHPMDMQVTRLFKEFLVGSTYYSLKNNIASDAESLLDSLAYTAIDTMLSIVGFVEGTEAPSSTLWLLSPNLRVVSPIEDIWTRLWSNTQQHTKIIRFNHENLSDKLLLSMDTCQPDALSRATTPITPSDSPLINLASQQKDIPGEGSLPFVERETYSFNQVEYLLSVNLREVSVHLLKMNPTLSPMMIHQIASQYVDEQSQKVKLLCGKIFQLFNVKKYGSKGFDLINSLNKQTAVPLYELLEKYVYAIESLAFPRPEGFLAFLTYLGYVSLDFKEFVEHVSRGALHLNLEIVLMILQGEKSNDDLSKKIEVLTHLPSARARHALKFWDHPASCAIQAKEHVDSILSGKAFRKHKHPSKISHHKDKDSGLAAFPSAEGYSISPLDTFLDLLTAKVDIRMLNLGLLVQAIQESISSDS